MLIKWGEHVDRVCEPPNKSSKGDVVEKLDGEVEKMEENKEGQSKVTIGRWGKVAAGLWD